MKKGTLVYLAVWMTATLIGCAGMKVIHPGDENKNEGTLMLDHSSGKLVSTYTCKLKSSGKNNSAIGKTEDDARKEVLAKCRDKTVISFCKEDQIKCVKN